mmetsp:Transcript_13088/g.41810  ORF Transcript_13088/g.41810 Transcript_13088/m.41810 type:complete len:206 (+) Transcript_13088:65-682(+)
MHYTPTLARVACHAQPVSVVTLPQTLDEETPSPPPAPPVKRDPPTQHLPSRRRSYCKAHCSNPPVREHRPCRTSTRVHWEPPRSPSPGSTLDAHWHPATAPTAPSTRTPSETTQRAPTRLLPEPQTKRQAQTPRPRHLPHGLTATQHPRETAVRSPAPASPSGPPHDDPVPTQRECERHSTAAASEAPPRPHPAAARACSPTLLP